MIKGYKELTGKYMRSKLKRTILTIVGIILSVALISSIGLFVKGLQAVEIEDMKNNYGSFHIAYKNLNEDLLSKITSNPKVSRSGLLEEDGDISINENLTVSKTCATDKALELLPYKIKEGKFPAAENEAAVESWVLKYIDNNAVIGNKIKIGDSEYILTGILEDNIQSQIENKGILMSKTSNMDLKKALLLVEISSHTNLKKAVNEFMQMGEAGSVTKNTRLLVVLGVTDDFSGSTGIYIIVSVIIGIVVISTIAVIYNSFQISVVERIRQFGLLRAVGATSRQIRKIVLREATIIAAIAIPIGLLSGIAAIYLIHLVFNIIGGDSVKLMIPTISPAVIAISFVVGTVSVYISALIPAFFAGRISPLIAISSRAYITKEKPRRGKNRLIGMLFGFEGALAAKNMKRNRKRYRITVFSIVISVVLFVTFKSFMDMSFNVTDNRNESTDIHFSVMDDSNAKDTTHAIDNKTIESLKALPSIKNAYKTYDIYNFHTIIDKSSESEDIKKLGGIYGSMEFQGEDKTLMQGMAAIYDAGSMEAAKKYVESGSIDIDEMNRENEVIIINKNRVYNSKTKNMFYGPAANLKVGDEIYLQYKAEPDTPADKGKFIKVKIAAFLKDDPFTFYGSENGLKLVVTEEMAKKLTGLASISPTGMGLTVKDVKNGAAAQAEIENVLKANPSLKLINNIDQNRNGKSAILMVEILIYGFVIVVSLIGCVNIINTLTTNMILRKREFAMLKAIGLTQRGLKKMIVLEGFMYGIVGTVYGSIIGCGLSYLLFTGMNYIRESGWRIPWDAIAIAGVSALIIGYLSVLSPLSRIKKENLIEAIREDG